MSRRVAKQTQTAKRRMFCPNSGTRDLCGVCVHNGLHDYRFKTCNGQIEIKECPACVQVAQVAPTSQMALAHG